MTNDAHPFYFKKLTQTSYRHATNNDGKHMEIDCNEDFSKYSDHEIANFKKRIKQEIDEFFALMLAEDKQFNMDKDKLFALINKRLGL